MTSCCCYIVDENYLFPTLLSAIQARGATDPTDTSIKIFCIGEPTARTELFTTICAGEHVGLEVAPADAIDGMPIMFARYFLHRLLDARHQAVLYMDGDTQITGSLTPLLKSPVPSGTFMAVRDPMSIVLDQPQRMWRERLSYMRSIAMSEPAIRRYCNSGVLRFDLADWREISRRVLRVSADHRHALRFPDQDPLNIAFGPDFDVISFRWNFPSFLMNDGLETLIRPAVYHFMSNPRPWQGPFRPWGQAWHAPYLRLLERYPDLVMYDRPLSRIRKLRYHLQQPFKSMVEGPLWRSPRVRDRILQVEREAVA